MRGGAVRLFLVFVALTGMKFVRLPQLSVVVVTGTDAPKIANNLCTANVLTLGVGEGGEAFITEVRGKMLGHVCLYRTDPGLILIGAGPSSSGASSTGEEAVSQAAAVVAHLDRYTLREDSVPTDASGEYAGLLLDRELAASLDPSLASLCDGVADGKLVTRSITTAVSELLGDGAGVAESLACYSVPWWEGGAVLILAEPSLVDRLADRLRQRGHADTSGVVEVDEAEFHRLRIEAFFPWFGVDVNATHLPQEADRDRVAISFTKGCYLGQETVARLDALGQVQKKLVRFRITCCEPPAQGTELRDGEKVVGRLTSVAADGSAQSLVMNSFVALGFARRSHFEPGSRASGMTESGAEIQAVVDAVMR
jgi:tRNA-modifying protein YgfZ